MLAAQRRCVIATCREDNSSRGRYADSELLWAIEPTISQRIHQKGVYSRRKTDIMNNTRHFDPANGHWGRGVA